MTKQKITIPKGWEVLTLGNLSMIKKGEQLNRLDLTEFGDYPALNGGIGPSGYTDNWNMEANTITISEGGNSCGYVNFNKQRFWCGGHCYAIRNIKENVNNNFLYQALKSQQSNIMKLRVGSGLPNIQKKSIESFSLLVPPLVEQTIISEILSKVDEDIEKTEGVIKNTEKLKKGLMRELFSGRVRVPLSFRTKQSEERNPLNVVNGKRGDDSRLRDSSLSVGMTKKTKLGEIPEEWRIKDFIEVAVLQRGFDLPASKRIKGDYVLVSSNGITDLHNEYKVKAPGVVTGRSGTIGKVFYIENDFWPLNTTLYIKDFKGNNEKFIYYFLQRLNIQDFYTGTGVPTLNRNNVHVMKVAIPSLVSEQKQIAEILSSVDNKIQINKQIKNKLAQLKKGLMGDLLSGRVRVKIYD